MEKEISAVEWLAEKYNYVNWMRNRDEISAATADEWRKKYLDQAKQMDEKIKQIVDAIKINIEIAKVDGKPLIAEVSMNEKSKKYIANLIKEYGEMRYDDGVEYGGNI